MYIPTPDRLHAITDVYHVDALLDNAILKSNGSFALQTDAVKMFWDPFQIPADSFARDMLDTVSVLSGVELHCLATISYDIKGVI